jgi:hypothetical protein
VRINYRRISLSHNLNRKCRKIVKFVSITHSERNIWNGPIVATAIWWEKLNHCWRKMAVSLTERICLEFGRCNSFWGFNARSDGNLEVVVLLRRRSEGGMTLPELRERINTVIGNVTQDILGRVCSVFVIIRFCNILRQFTPTLYNQMGCDFNGIRKHPI